LHYSRDGCGGQSGCNRALNACLNGRRWCGLSCGRRRVSRLCSTGADFRRGTGRDRNVLGGNWSIGPYGYLTHLRRRVGQYRRRAQRSATTERAQRYDASKDHARWQHIQSTASLGTRSPSTDASAPIRATTGSTAAAHQSAAGVERTPVCVTLPVSYRGPGLNASFNCQPLCSW